MIELCSIFKVASVNYIIIIAYYSCVRSRMGNW